MDKIKIVCSYGAKDKSSLFNKSKSFFFDKSELNDCLISLEKDGIININTDYYFYYDDILECIKLIKDKKKEYPNDVKKKLSDRRGVQSFIKEITFMMEYKIKPQKSFMEYLNMIDYERFADDLILTYILEIKDNLKNDENDVYGLYYKTFSENLENIISEIKVGMYDNDTSKEIEELLENEINCFTQHLYDTVSLTKEVEKFGALSLFEIPKIIKDVRLTDYKAIYLDHCVTLEKLKKIKGGYVNLYLVPINITSRYKLGVFAGYDYGISFKLYTKKMLMEKYEIIENYLTCHSLKWKDIFRVHAFSKNNTYLEIRVLDTKYEDILYSEFKNSVLKE